MSKPVRLCAVLVAGVTIIACTPQYTRESTREFLQDTQAVEHQQVSREGNWVLPQNAKIQIAYPMLAQADKQRRLNRTQYALAEALRTGFLRYFPASQVSFDSRSVSEALSDARSTSQDFLIYPELLAISRNPTAENADQYDDEKSRLNLNFRLYDVRSRKLLDTLNVTSGQGWLDLSQQEPKKLVDKSIEAAVKKLSGN